MIKPVFDALNRPVGDGSEVGFLRQETANEAVGIFDGAFFPGVIGFTEERAQSEALIEFDMQEILQAVVIGDTGTQRRIDGTEQIAENIVGGLCGSIGNFLKTDIACLSFDQDLKSDMTGTDDEIGLPMPGHLAKINFRRTQSDGNALGNRSFRPGPSMAGTATRVMTDQMRNGHPRLRVDPLIDCLGADDR